MSVKSPPSPAQLPLGKAQTNRGNTNIAPKPALHPSNSPSNYSTSGTSSKSNGKAVVESTYRSLNGKGAAQRFRTLGNRVVAANRPVVRRNWERIETVKLYWCTWCIDKIVGSLLFYSPTSAHLYPKVFLFLCHTSPFLLTFEMRYLHLSTLPHFRVDPGVLLLLGASDLVYQARRCDAQRDKAFSRWEGPPRAATARRRPVVGGSRACLSWFRSRSSSTASRGWMTWSLFEKKKLHLPNVYFILLLRIAWVCIGVTNLTYCVCI